MRSSHNVLSAGSLVRWCGLLGIVLAIAAGILGMHVIGGAQAAPITLTSMNSAAATPQITVAAASMAEHPVSSHAAVAGESVVDATQPDLQKNPAVCGCVPAGCEGSMATHGACVPSFGPSVLIVAVPKILAPRSTVTAFALVLGCTSESHVLDPPSLNQLSISRT